MIRILLCFSLMLSLSGSLPTDVESNAVNKEGMESVFAEVLRIDPTTREPRTYDFGLTGYDDDEEEVEEEDDEDEDHVDKKKTKDYELRKPGAYKSPKGKKLNRMLMALVIAYTLKFMFLLPTMMGGLVLLKFTMLLAGFFYALFAAILGLERPPVHHY